MSHRSLPPQVPSRPVNALPIQPSSSNTAPPGSGTLNPSSSSSPPPSGSADVLRVSDVVIYVVQARHGDCFMLQFVEQKSDASVRRRWLIDGGPGNSTIPLADNMMFNNLFRMLNELSVDRLDKVIVTHNHSDHVNGVILLLASLVAMPEVDDVRQYFKEKRVYTSADGKDILNLWPEKSKPPSSSISSSTSTTPSPSSSSTTSSSSPNNALMTAAGESLVWTSGSQLRAKDKKLFPIDEIWFNDRATRSQAFPEKRLSKTYGWVEAFLHAFDQLATPGPAGNRDGGDSNTNVVGDGSPAPAPGADGAGKNPSSTPSTTADTTNTTFSTPSLDILNKSFRKRIALESTGPPAGYGNVVTMVGPLDESFNGVTDDFTVKSIDLWMLRTNWKRKVDPVRLKKPPGEKTRTQPSRGAGSAATAAPAAATSAVDQKEEEEEDGEDDEEDSDLEAEGEIVDTTPAAATSPVVAVVPTNAVLADVQQKAAFNKLLKKFWTADIMDNTAEPSSSENNASIMFELSAAGPSNSSSSNSSAPSQSFLFTGDGTGWDIDKLYSRSIGSSTTSSSNGSGIPSTSTPAPDGGATASGATATRKHFTIFKVPHHGSQGNNRLQNKNSDEDILDFFLKYNADNYIISSEPVKAGTQPNPDSSVLRAIVIAHRLQGLVPPAIYLTNGCSIVGHTLMTIDPSKGIPTILFLKRGTPHGPVSPNSGSSTEWEKIDTDVNHYGYFDGYIRDFQSYLEDSAGSSNQNDIVAFLREKSFSKNIGVATNTTIRARPKSASSVGITPKRKNPSLAKRVLPTWMDLPPTTNIASSSDGNQMTTTTSDTSTDASGGTGTGTPSPGISSSNLPIPILPSNQTPAPSQTLPTNSQAGMTTRNASRKRPSVKRFVLRAVKATPPSNPMTPTSSQITWHDIMLSGMFNADITSTDDLDQIPTLGSTATNLDRLTGDTICIWSNMGSFIDYLLSAAGMDAAYMAFVKRVIPADPSESSQLLLGTFISTFFNGEFAKNLLCQLPINANGLDWSMNGVTDLINPAILSLQVINFRAALPQLTLPSCIAPAIFFQLSQPPAGLVSFPPAEALNWTVPFQDSQWTTGHINLAHSGPLNIKIIAPFYENRTVLCRFAGQITFGRVAGTKPLGVSGMMVACGAEPAAYDFRLSSDAGNTRFAALDLINILAPLDVPATGLFQSMFGAAVATLAVPGLDFLSSALSEVMHLDDAGIVLHQVNLGFSSVTIEDIYGTLDIKDGAQALMSALNSALKLPAGLAVPSDAIPNITVMLRNITAAGAGVNQISLAFEWSLSQFGTVAVEIAPGGSSQVKIDLWLVCNPDVTFGDLFANALFAVFGFADDKDAFQAARLFADDLSTFHVPYLRLSFSVDTVAKSVNFVSYGFNISIDSVSLGPVTLEEASLSFVKLAGQGSDITVYGSATLSFGGIDAICSFSVDHSGAALAELVDLSEDDETVPEPAQTTINISLAFADTRPTISGIFETIIGAADGLKIWNSVPSELQWIFGGVAFNSVSLAVTSDGTSWSLANILIDLDLDAFEGDFSVLGTCFSFTVPTLTVAVGEPSNPKTRQIIAQVGTTVSVADAAIELYLNLSDGPQLRAFPNSSQSNDTLTFGLNTVNGKLLFIQAFEHFLRAAVGDKVPNSVQGLFGALFPDKIVNELENLSLDKALITVANKPKPNGSSSYTVAYFEAMISSTIVSWQPWSALGGFSINDIYFRVIYDTGIRPGSKQVTSTCGFDLTCTAKFGDHAVLSYVSYHHESVADSVSVTWSLSLRETAASSIATLELGDLIVGCAKDISFDVSSIRSQLNEMLTIDVASLAVTYMESTDVSSVSFSQQGKGTQILGINLTSISVFCEKIAGANSWSWTIALQATKIENPLAKICPLFDVVEIYNVSVAYWSGRCSSTVSTAEQLPGSSSSFMLAGTLALGDNAFLEVIKSCILHAQPSIDFCITQDSFQIQKSVGSSGLQVFNIFTLLGFVFSADKLGFSVGGKMSLDAQWLSKDVTDPTMPKRPQLDFNVVVHEDGGLGLNIAITSLNEPFGIPGLEVDNLFVMVVILVTEGTLESLAITGTFKIKGTDILASIDLGLSIVDPSLNRCSIDIVDLTVVNVVQALSGGKLPHQLVSIGDAVMFQELKLSLALKAGPFSLFASIYFFGLHGVVDARVDPTPGPSCGIVLGTSLSVVDIFGIVSLTSFKDKSSGPYFYLNTTLSGDFKAPPELDITSTEQALSVGVPLLLTGKLVFLGMSFGFYGEVSVSSGLALKVARDETLNIPGVALSTKDITTVNIDTTSFALTHEWGLSLDISLPNISLAGLSLGSIDIPAFDVDCITSYTVKYSGADWMHDGLIFNVGVKADLPLLNVTVNENITIPLTLQSMHDLPGIIEDFFTDYFIKEIGNIISPFKEGFEKTKEAAIAAANFMSQEINMLEREVVAALVVTYHAIEDGLLFVGHAIAGALDYGIHETTRALNEIGCTAVEISDVLSDVFDASAADIASAMMGAGVAVEIAFEAAFGNGGASIAKGFDNMESAVASGVTDVAFATVDFFEHTIGDKVKDAADVAIGGIKDIGSDVGDHVKDVGGEIGHKLKGWGNSVAGLFH